MYNVILILHILVAIGLMGAILIQRGRSGGLIEALGGVESIFGTKTSSFFVKLTVILAILFFLTSISLAYISKQKGKSLLDTYKDTSVKTEPVSKDSSSQNKKEEAVPPVTSTPGAKSE
jgi:preprotein translocase subunit SecG